MMSVIPGIEVKLYIDGSEAAIGGALRLETKADPVEITTLADTARRFTPGKCGWKMLFAGVIAFTETMMTQMASAALTRSFVIVRMQVEGKLFGGIACINRLTIAADNGKTVQIEAELQGAGEMGIEN